MSDYLLREDFSVSNRESPTTPFSKDFIGVQINTLPFLDSVSVFIIPNRTAFSNFTPPTDGEWSQGPVPTL